jgi:hypothetical protein
LGSLLTRRQIPGLFIQALFKGGDPVPGLVNFGNHRIILRDQLIPLHEARANRFKGVFPVSELLVERTDARF